MTLTGFLAYTAALAVAAAIPGPGIAALVARALGSGFRSSLAMASGLLIGDLIYLTAVVLGLAFVAQSFGLVFLAVKWLGVAYLAFLGWRFWTSGITPEAIEARAGKGGLFSCFLAGLTLTLGNPKTMIFYLAITPTVIDLKGVTPVSYFVLVAITVATLTVVLVPYLALASRARWFLRSPRALKRLNRTAAAFMMGAAVAIAARP